MQESSFQYLVTYSLGCADNDWTSRHSVPGRMEIRCILQLQTKEDYCLIWIGWDMCAEINNWLREVVCPDVIATPHCECLAHLTYSHDLAFRDFHLQHSKRLSEKSSLAPVKTASKQIFCLQDTHFFKQPLNLVKHYEKYPQSEISLNVLSDYFFVCSLLFVLNKNSTHGNLVKLIFRLPLKKFKLYLFMSMRIYL